jgi:hypothetical protein
MKKNIVKSTHLGVHPINSHINNVTWPRGHYKYFLQNPQLTFYSTKHLSDFPQLSTHNNFPTTHSWNQIFRNPRLNQTNPKPQMVAAAKVVIVEVEEQPKG